MTRSRRADRGQLEQKLLILVTLGLVAFGLVMVFSATSASAALGAGDPMRFLVKQGLYAVVGLVLLAVVSRVDYHALRPLAALRCVPGPCSLVEGAHPYMMRFAGPSIRPGGNLRLGPRLSSGCRSGSTR